MKYIFVITCLFLFFSSPIAAEEPFSVASELAKPGVKLVVLEFYASYCMPCRKAVPQWNLLHQKYRSKGLRFVVITLDEQGKCTDPGWSPDRVICDKDRYWQKHYGVENLPQAFLYTWQGELISERSHVEQVEQAIVRFFTDTQLRMTVDQPEVLGDKCALGSNPEWVRDYLVGQLGRGSKFDVVDEATKALPKMTEAGQCSVFFPPNSNLRIRLSGDCEGNRTLNLTLEKDGCVLASSQQPYKGKGFKEDVDSLKWAAREAVKEVIEAVTKVKMPAAMVLGKPGGEDWFEDMKVVVLNFSPQPIGMVLVDGKAACRETPCSKSYPPGNHEITISAENHLTRTETLAISVDRTIDWKLTPDFGLLNISSEPPGLAVTIDRQEKGETPLAKKRLAPRSHLVEIGNACYYKEQQTVTLDRGDEKTLTFKPQAIEGGLELTVKDDRGNVIRAEASIDARPIGQAPGRFKVSVCAKELVVSAAGYGEYKEKVAIVEKKLTSVDVVLKKVATIPVAKVAERYLVSKSMTPAVSIKRKTAKVAGRYLVSKGEDGKKIVLDKQSKLTWTKKYWNDKKWQAAIDHCAGLTYAGYDDWRLPTIDELKTLLDDSLGKAPYSTFPDMPATWFWSSSSNGYIAALAWFVYFGDGLVYYDSEDNALAARCVRP